MASATFTETDPHPANAHFGLEIDFVRGAGPASRVFIATYRFIRVCEELDLQLLTCIDPKIQTQLILDEIKQGSIKSWLRNELKLIDDDSLKALDWKSIIGAYLVRAKHAVLRYTEEDNKIGKLPDLREQLRQIAERTNVRHFPDYTPPSTNSLIEAIKGFQQIKDHLVEGDRAKFLSAIKGVPDIEFNLSARIPDEEIDNLAVQKTVEISTTKMILTVRRPDYLGNAKWGLRHKKKNIEAKIEDTKWLTSFQRRGVEILPGDALRCRVLIEHLYGFDDELISERYTVLEVIEVISGDSGPHIMLDFGKI